MNTKQFAKQIIKCGIYSTIVSVVLITVFYTVKYYVNEKEHEETMIYLVKAKDDLETKLEKVNADKGNTLSNIQDGKELEPEITPEKTDSTDDIFESGLYAGMTYREAVNIWNDKRDKLDNDHSEYLDKLLANSRKRTQTSKRSEDAILSMYKLMSPEQVKEAKNEALKTMPKSKVDEFFELVKGAKSKTSEEIEFELLDIEKSKSDVAEIAKQLKTEKEDITKRRNELERDKPSNYLHLLQ